MKAQHTPGPWRIGIQNYHAVITGPHGLPVARTQACHDENWEANARLIAVAPELLQLLIDTGRWLECGLKQGQINCGTGNRDGDLVSQIRAAITKATSQP